MPVGEFDERPWGRYDVLDEADGFKVKRIRVTPGKRLSLQSHKHRQEHWFVVEGVAEVTIGDDVVSLKTGEHCDIPLGAVHRAANPGSEDLVFIEVQRGSYLGEDDIVRYSDDFGRS